MINWGDCSVEADPLMLEAEAEKEREETYERVVAEQKERYAEELERQQRDTEKLLGKITLYDGPRKFDLDEDQCRARAASLKLKYMGASSKSSWTPGCYTYTSGKHKGKVWFGRHGTQAAKVQPLFGDKCRPTDYPNCLAVDYDQVQCQRKAQEMGLTWGGNGYDAVGDSRGGYSPGCYMYNSRGGGYKNRVYFGTMAPKWERLATFWDPFDVNGQMTQSKCRLWNPICQF